MGIHIGDKNRIKNSNIASHIENKQRPESFWKLVLVNLTSNLIWWILGVAATVALIIFGDDIINLLK